MGMNAINNYLFDILWNLIKNFMVVYDKKVFKQSSKKFNDISFSTNNLTKTYILGLKSHTF